MKRKSPGTISKFLSKPNLIELEARETPAVFFVNPALSPGTAEGAPITAVSQAANFNGAPLVNGTYSADTLSATTPAAVWFNSLEAALAQAAANGATADTIYLSKGTHTANNSLGTIVINDSITIIGSGSSGGLASTIVPSNDTATSTDFVFNTPAGKSLTLTDLAYDGSAVNDNAFRWSGSTGIVTNVSMTGAGYDTGGGNFVGISLYGRDASNLTVTNSNFNVVEGRTGVTVYNSTATVTGSNFTGQGGAISYGQDGIDVIGSSKATISGCTFTTFQGAAPGDGSAAIFAYAFAGGSPEIYVTRSDFTSNSVGIVVGQDGDVNDNSAAMVAYCNFVGQDNLGIQAGDGLGTADAGPANSKTGLVNARFNWWGDPSGASSGPSPWDGVYGPLFSTGVTAGQPVINTSQPLQSPRGTANANQSAFLTGASVTNANSKVTSYSTTSPTPTTFTPAIANPNPTLPGNVAAGASRIAYGDITGDGIKDYAVGAVAGVAPTVEIYNGATGALITSFSVLNGSKLGVNVAMGDLNGDGQLDLIVGASVTASIVQVYNGATINIPTPAPGLLNGISFNAYNGFATGVSVAAGDINGDGLDDIITGVTGNNQPSNVKVWDAKDRLINPTGTLPTSSFYAYQSNPSSLLAGAFVMNLTVSAGDINGDGFADIATGGASTNNVRVFRFSQGSLLQPTATTLGSVANPYPINSTVTLATSFSPFSTSTNGARVAIRDLNNDGYADLLYTSAVAVGAPTAGVYAISGNNPLMIASKSWSVMPGTVNNLLTTAYPAVNQTGGVYVA